MKNNKGVTLVALIITVIVLLIISGTIITTSNLIQQGEKQKIITEMLLIQTKVRIIRERVAFSGTSEGYYVGILQESGLYEYDQQTLNSIGLEGIKLTNQKYLVDYENGDIKCQIGDTIAYTISE